MFGAGWYFFVNRNDSRSLAQAFAEKPAQTAMPSPTPINIPISNGFDYPVGKTKSVTQAKDRDGWYNAQDFGANNHLGEDWNGAAGGNTDCGAPVYAASKDLIMFAGKDIPGWGNVLIIRHKLPNGEQIETLYGHLQEMAKTSGEVNRREYIGTIGNGSGKYLCHLHFELRTSDCPVWGAHGSGYGEEKSGWKDPSYFIDAHRNLGNN